ncbi:cytochrome c oxidase accessory protein CcoG [Alteromonas confluentis]|uniref:Cytochrome c oxidase accessory protein CcoG n=1 Tax=Alteromonas confluentis TaxID=1656094 RepID=A0A1E7ZET4_9ALTE|nr:cytochrome c oxidase accessory protein CcoG [Alteromonas confluentis]OFC72023.1 cytochrome c oxidase accessory protein CcoG [Alteromonas confluentis]
MSEQIQVKNVSPVKVHQPPGGSNKKRPSARSQIYVRAVKGPIETFRRLFGFIFVGIFALIPWIQYDGHQAILLDIMNQRFTIFGLTLWPQDLTLLAYIFIVGAFALFFVTTFAGRVWCGFMCPQTTWVYMYVWFEEKIEGPRNKRIKLDERPLDFDKFWRKSLKHIAWLSVAMLTALTFVGYFTPIGALFIDFFTFNASFWAVFSILFFAGCTYGNAGWMREIMCTHMCPYARFQSAMFDKDTFTVSYDYNRGEKRGPRPRKLKHEELADKALGDCIDCNLCVQVCPTGIDIRNGLQYECINCGACVDACNGVMEKMNYPKGLISFTSEERLTGGHTNIVRPKLIGYFVVLLVMIGLLMADILTRSPLEVDLIRDRNSLFRENGRGNVENVYTIKILNKSQDTHTYTIEVKGLASYNILADTTVTVGGGEVFSMPLSLETSPKNLSEAVTDIYFHVRTEDAEGNVVEVDEPTKFLYR